MSAQRLRDAAQKIREMAEAATFSPWNPGKSWAGALTVMGNLGQPIAVVATDTGGISPNANADAAHIALWSPPLALAVADWLDREADRGEHAYAPALTVANIILGEPA